MPVQDAAFWSDAVRRTLERYDEPLLRLVAGKLFKPRSHWPVEELIERTLATIENAAVIDRRLQDLDAAGRRLLALLAHSRQPRWQLGNLVELLVALGHADGLRPILSLCEIGLLYPVLRERGNAVLMSFGQWLGRAGSEGASVFAHPFVVARALGEDLGLPELPAARAGSRSVQEADGLEWPLRLAALWQLALGGPLRRTQQGDFFKRDLDRLQQDALLNAPPADSLAELPDPSYLAVALAQLQGILREQDGELTAGALPASWEDGLPALLSTLWSHLPQVASWNPHGKNQDQVGNPYPSAHLLALLLLARLSGDQWIAPASVEKWLVEQHPYWAATTGKKKAAHPAGVTGIGVFLLGLAYQMRLVQATKDSTGEWIVRLAPLGRWLLGIGDAPPQGPGYAQTLLVQPNLEIIAYRQGLTPGLIVRLSQFALWKSFGAACTLQLQAETVYRAMESGLTFESILQTLEQSGMRQTPAAVVESLRTWANKRDRISVYPAAALFEFGTAEDLNEALARGLPGVRLSDRLALVSSESGVDFRHFRLSGTRDYALPPEKCIEVEGDGVTLAVDLTRSDLLLETELQRFAEPVEGVGVNGRRRYRVTPESLTAARTTGLAPQALDAWFQQRAGQPLSAATRFLLTGAQAPPPQLRKQLVLHVATPELADGLQQWPGTRGFIQARLGPTTLAITEEHAEPLRECLRGLGIDVEI